MKGKLKRILNWQWSVLLFLAVYLSGCKDDADASLAPYDPSSPVEITDFTPKSGGAKTQMVIYGSNFGTDKSIISVKIGGKEAVVINAKGNSLYCLVPSKSYEGTIELTVGDTKVTANEKFSYERQMVVSTLYGKTRDDGTYDIMDGSFDESFSEYYGIAEPTWFSFDPKDHNILYLAQDNGKPLRILDLKNQTISTGLSTGNVGTNRFRTLAWTADGDTLIIANDGGDGGSEDANITSSVYVLRSNDFKNPQILSVGKQCNGAAIHPVNGELYYNSYTKGNVYRYDYHQYGVGATACINNREQIATIQDNNWEFNIVIHPSGDYAYIVVINQHYIMRMNYNWTTKKFGTPYLICGEVGTANWVDGVGSSARLSTPYQGVFVKNKDYEAEGKEDIYDFYFCDRGNQAVRILTPEGVVTTFAGRGSPSINDNADGYIDGAIRDEARFSNPCALAYDEETETFYVGDVNNHLIRKIALEEEDDEVTEDE